VPPLWVWVKKLKHFSLQEHLYQKELQNIADDKIFWAEAEADAEHKERWDMNAEDHRERHLNPPGDVTESEDQQPQIKKLRQL
jgi:hypothetical protein